MTPSKSTGQEILKHWKECALTDFGNPKSERILALIDFIEKKDKLIERHSCIDFDDYDKQALALTNTLGD